jgi:hypothetical protein
MLNGLPMIMLVAAQAASAASSSVQPAAAYGPALPATPKPAVKTPSEPCKSTEPKDVKDDTTEIVVCAPHVEGYRIDPDVLEAQRSKKNRNKPRGPERLIDNSCASVGPMGCRGGAGIDLVAAALTAATMIEKAAKGENVGQMYVTDPTPSEYQLYLEAKRRREARHAEETAMARAKAVAETAGGGESKSSN